MSDEHVRNDVFSWTIMSGVYSQHNLAKDAMKASTQICQGVQPRRISY